MPLCACISDNAACKCKLLSGLHALVNFYAPALLVIGFQVRELTWNGGSDGVADGSLARRTLAQCLALQVHMLDDWDARFEYSRTIAIALLMWTPWMSHLPGCCFAEEPCEAMLSRMASRMDKNRNLTNYEQIMWLFISMPPPESKSKATGCGLKPSLIRLINSRAIRLINHADAMPFAMIKGAQEAQWVATYPDSISMPMLPTQPNKSLKTVFQAALCSLAGKSSITPAVQYAAQEVLGDVDETDLERKKRLSTLTLLKQWTNERRDRMRMSATSQPKPRAKRQQAVKATIQQPVTSIDSTDNQATQQPDQPLSPSPSSDDSLYMPPDTDSDLPVSVHSPADSDGLGSIGDLQSGEDDDWITSMKEDC